MVSGAAEMLDLNLIRAQFPALAQQAVFLDNPGGTQISCQSLDRINQYLLHTNANHGGSFQTSRLSDETIQEAREAMADFLNATSPDEIIFGANMTSLTFSISRALAPIFEPGDTIVVTHLDHDANISPWLRMAEDRNLHVRWVDFHPEDGTLNLEDFQAAMLEKPKLVAFGYASNALGTINPVNQLTALAKEAGAWVYVDAVQYAAHGAIDVQEINCDFLVCSSYKFFGPHAGILYGKYDLLNQLRAYRVRPAPADPPGKFETGTGNFEGIAGILGAVEHFEWLGHQFGAEFAELVPNQIQGRKRTLRKGIAAVRAYEQTLSQHILAELTSVPGLKVYGIADPARVEKRVATISFTMEQHPPQEIARYLDTQGIYTWDGNFYALAVTNRLELENHGGLLRVGAVHYNTFAEIERLGAALRALAG